MTDGSCEVLVEFDARATNLMRGRRWHEHQVVAELEDGRSIFSVKAVSLDQVEPWVLSWGAHARVIEPVELKERVVRAVGQMGARYRPDF